MLIIEVTGPPGSGKSTLLGLAAQALVPKKKWWQRKQPRNLALEVHNTPSLARYAIDCLIRDAADAPPGQRIVFFDEVDRFVGTTSFRDFLESGPTRHSNVRVVLIGERL